MRKIGGSIMGSALAALLASACPASAATPWQENSQFHGPRWAESASVAPLLPTVRPRVGRLSDSADVALATARIQTAALADAAKAFEMATEPTPVEKSAGQSRGLPVVHGVLLLVAVVARYRGMIV
jgi:hypothetical protein